MLMSITIINYVKIIIDRSQACDYWEEEKLIYLETIKLNLDLQWTKKFFSKFYLAVNSSLFQ